MHTTISHRTPESKNGSLAELDFESMVEGSLYPHEEPLTIKTMWQIRGPAQALEERPPIQYVVDSLFPYGSLSIEYGQPGGLKSLVMADLAVCVALGRNWLEPLPTVQDSKARTFRTEGNPVFWAEWDNGTRRTDDRFGALLRAYDAPLDTPLHYASMQYPMLKADQPALVAQLGELILDLGAKLVVLDNLGLITGDAEENSADMSDVMGNLRTLAETTGAAIVVIHHQRKSSSVDGRRGETLRGHSSIEAALDLALLVERKEGEDTVIIRSTKVRGVPVEPFGAMFTYQHKPGTTDLHTARFFGAAVLTREEREAREIRNCIYRSIKRYKEREGKPANQSELVKEVQELWAVDGKGKPPSQARIRGNLNEMESAGQIVVEQGAHAAKFYYVPTTSVFQSD